MSEISVMLFQASSWLTAWIVSHHRLIDDITKVVALCSFLHTVLPPWDWNPDFVRIGLREFPTAQKLFYATFNNRWYRVCVYVIGYMALNARSTVWKFISVNNPEGPNANTPTTVVETVTSEKVVIPSKPPNSSDLGDQ